MEIRIWEDRRNPAPFNEGTAMSVSHVKASPLLFVGLWQVSLSNLREKPNCRARGCITITATLGRFVL
jgi:hypothetical protein